MQARGLSEQDFKAETVRNYVIEFGLKKELAEEIALKEWAIRCEVEKDPKLKGKHKPKTASKTKAKTYGFGTNPIKLS